MAKTLKVGVIGTGVGVYHLEGYLSHPRAEIVALCDNNPAALETIGGWLAAQGAAAVVE